MHIYYIYMLPNMHDQSNFIHLSHTTQIMHHPRHARIGIDSLRDKIVMILKSTTINNAAS